MIICTEASGTSFLEISYDWHVEELVEDTSGNIFGENSLLEVECDVLHVPCCDATLKNLAFFNAILQDKGDSLVFEVPKAIDLLPVTIMDVGKVRAVQHRRIVP